MVRQHFLGRGWPFPMRPAAGGSLALVEGDSKISQSIWLILSTAPGERVMRPDFGTGLSALLFAPNSTELAATTQVLVQGALTQWLGRLITVDTVEVTAIDSAIQITVGYTIIRSQTREQATFQREGPT